MTELTNVLKRGHKAAEKCCMSFKELNNPEDESVKDHCHYTWFYWEAAQNNCNLKYRMPDHMLNVFDKLSGYDAHPFIMKLAKKFNRDNVGVTAENK